VLSNPGQTWLKWVTKDEGKYYPKQGEKSKTSSKLKEQTGGYELMAAIDL
jgi:hypothetical protein